MPTIVICSMFPLLPQVTYQTELGQTLDLLTSPNDSVDFGRFSIERCVCVWCVLLHNTIGLCWEELSQSRIHLVQGEGGGTLDPFKKNCFPFKIENYIAIGSSCMFDWSVTYICGCSW